MCNQLSLTPTCWSLFPPPPPRNPLTLLVLLTVPLHRLPFQPSKWEEQGLSHHQIRGQPLAGARGLGQPQIFNTKLFHCGERITMGGQLLQALQWSILVMKYLPLKSMGQSAQHWQDHAHYVSRTSHASTNKFRIWYLLLFLFNLRRLKASLC